MLAILYASFKVESSTIELIDITHLFQIKYKGDEYADEFHAEITDCISRIGDIGERHLRDYLYKELVSSPGMQNELFDYCKTPKSERQFAPLMQAFNRFRSKQREARNLAHEYLRVET